MRIYQPMLFVGLGGTGCKVGAELERRMREDLCGPSGTNLLEKMKGKDYLPFQLPSCLQFVYADLSQDELAQARRTVVPGREHDAAARRTMHLITNLVPAHLRNSAVVAQSLRLNLPDDTIAWLPSKRSDPKIGPLGKGAGQLPTVGRAVLFETLRNDRSSVVRGIEDALERINQSGPDLLMASNRSTNQVNQINVFVVFSVAGGTGGGIFYDYLHLIGEVLKDEGNHRSFQIFPLVLMPSAFENGNGGGRNAELNAGPALVDLFRLIDDQNAHGSAEVIGRRESDGNLDVCYPNMGRVALSANTVPTAFLFGKPSGGLDQDNLRRSMVALILSLVGAGSTDEGDEEDGSAKVNMSYMDTFINGSVARNTPAGTGIGRRGVSTSAVAELRTPVFEIADIISSHLLAVAIRQLSAPPSLTEQNRSQIEKFRNDVGLQQLLQATPPKIPQITPGLVGEAAIIKALDERAEEMDKELKTLRKALSESVTELVREEFDLRSAATRQLRSIDLFRLNRVVFGDKSLDTELDKGGFRGVLYESARPRDVNDSPPPAQELLPRMVASVRSSDESVTKAQNRQDNWYAWRIQQEQCRAWAANRQIWERRWHDFEAGLKDLTEPFRTFAINESDQFKKRSTDLYRHRVSVTYLLPPHDQGMDGFYAEVLENLKERCGNQIKSVDAVESEILNAILGTEGWNDAYRAGQMNPTEALAYVRQAVQDAVSDRLRPNDPQETALVPHMSDLLARAAKPTREKSPAHFEAYVDEFNHKLAGLVPGALLPQGDGKLRILFTYPAAKPDKDLERFLENKVQPPRGPGGTLEFRDIDADSMVVVFLRSEMGITDVPEVRSVIDLWSEATQHEEREDILPWRRRLGQHSDYLLMSADDREHVLQRLLCVAWNGRLEVCGDPCHPQRVLVRLASDGSAMNLELTPLGTLSSWATLIQSYERWILGSDELVRRMLAKNLMKTEPTDLRTNPQSPAELYETIIGLKDGQLASIEQAKNTPQLKEDAQLRVFDDFWRNILPAALNRPIGGTNKTLSGLIEAVRPTTPQPGP